MSAQAAMRKALRRLKVTFRTKWLGAPGTPDLALVKDRVAVFVDTCAEHGCPSHPKDLLAAAVVRACDLRIDDQLLAKGWSVVRIWEHSLARIGGPEDCAVVIRLIQADAQFGLRSLVIL